MLKRIEKYFVSEKRHTAATTSPILTLVTIFFAVFVTGIMLAMAAVAGYSWGGAGILQPLMVAISVAICALTHFILVISRSRLAWVFWLGCLLGSVYGEFTFLAYASSRASEERPQRSLNVIGLEGEMAAVLNALADISARPVTIVANELANTRDWKIRRALTAELAEAKRAAALKDRMVRLSATTTTAKVTASRDQVISLLSEVTGGKDSNITIVRNIGFAILLELIGPWLWCQILPRRRSDTQVALKSRNEPDPVTELMCAVQAGRCSETVKGIREYLGCSQQRAVKLRRSLRSENC